MDQIVQFFQVRVHRAGWPFVAAAVVIAFVLLAINGVLGLVGLALAGWVVYFFRDPVRVTPTAPRLVISPADGVVCMIAQAAPPPELGMGPVPRPRISVFLNIFDVHVNRVPIDGTVSALDYRPGAFVNAALDKASTDNERMAARITLADGRDLAVVQIAGLVARRIICDLKLGQPVRAGQRYGIIRFGSRADIYLPEGTAPLVIVGQRAVGGETVLADLGSAEPARQGEVR
jgi:phosphatidylserine decarboxylase